MAFNVQQGRGGRRGRYYSRPPMSEINVTPMVDVMLVLLIVFMVAAPLLTVGVPVDLPKTQAEPLTGDTEPLTITIGKDGKVFVQETEVDPDKLVDQLLAIGENGYKQRIFVRADKDVTHGKVMEIMGRISAAGFSKVGLVTDTDTSPPSGAGKR
ncbi:protein TolR [Parvibaculum sp.]|uniref:protein TolR n=1 Tax=Parvibaculum sp. TaxID=2024848 RepID=UPI000C8BA0AD|nr:protein TolR [Parvibaculum sp.]MAB14898.1 protein TolR [Parvibaculum sp.]